MRTQDPDGIRVVTGHGSAALSAVTRGDMISKTKTVLYGTRARPPPSGGAYLCKLTFARRIKGGLAGQPWRESASQPAHAPADLGWANLDLRIVSRESEAQLSGRAKVRQRG